MQPPAPVEQDAPTEAEMRRVLGALLGLPDDHQAVTDLMLQARYYVEHRKWGTLPLVFAQGDVIGVGGFTYKPK